MFKDLSREVVTWEQFVDAVSIDEYSNSLASCGTNYHVHILNEGFVKISQSLFKATRPAALPLMIHSMTQLLPLILNNSVSCFKTLRSVLPFLDLSKVIIGN